MYSSTNHVFIKHQEEENETLQNHHQDHHHHHCGRGRRCLGLRCIRGRLWTMNYHPHHTTTPFLFTLFIFFILCFLIHGHHCLTVIGSDINQDSTHHQHHLISENENPTVIEDQLLENSFGEWSEWSQWSPCSRICDGGISTSLRRCLSRSGCIGHHKRNKLCNMQPCIVKTDYRQIQCSAFNNKPYRDRFYQWLAYIDPTDPCSLTCKAKGLNFVAKLAPYITDGTRCHPNSLDVCVSGKCLAVGCDLQLGSLKKIDECGVCGGDGSSCKNHSYSWSHRFYSNCSKTCGGGFRTSTLVCFDESTDTIVDDIFCMMINKPKPITNGCNEFECKASWVIEEWSPCSEKCGIGFQTREVYCAIEKRHKVRIKVMDNECTEKKPDTERKCNDHECAQWYEGDWSECSETCGNGIQRRSVVCKDSRGYTSNECQLSLKPIDQRNCSDISNCLNEKVDSQEDSPDMVDLTKFPNEPIFEIGPWTKCNVSCGMGYRKRSVRCKIYLDFSKTFLTIPPGQCTGAIPLEFEACYGQNCSQEKKLDDEFDDLHPSKNEKYEWTVTGFTKCSAHCLGGFQESIIECVRTRDNRIMPTDYCEENLRPETFTKICNDQPCIPRWNVSDFGECSKKCGEGGVQTRIVLCVHEIARGPNNFVVVPDNKCQSPKPSSEQKCNQVDCPAKWIVEPWQKCSRDCNGGMKKRNIYCVKDFVFGGLQNVSHLECSMKKPKISKQCNMKPCLTTNLYTINELVRKSKRNHYIGSFHKYNHKRAIKVQGKVTIFEGSRIKLFCPDWNAGLSSVIWKKGHDLIDGNRRFSINENILKIRNIKMIDTGVYKCIFDNNNTEHSMFLHVLSKNPNNPNFLSDQNVIRSSSADHYYQNELDVSQEMEKFSLKSESKRIGKINFREDENQHHPNKIRGGIHKLISTFKRPSANSYSDHQNEIGIEKKFDEKFFSQNLINDIATTEQPKQYDWITTDWSNCTIPCGGFGFKIRYSQCFQRIGNMTHKVEDSFCFDSGLQKPVSFETCGLESCSFWNIGPWSDCQGCIDINKGSQFRNVTCTSRKNQTILDDSICFQWRDKPITKQECFHSQCIPIWLTGESMDDDGTTSRSVRCVWKTNQEQIVDDSFCEDNLKPITSE